MKSYHLLLLFSCQQLEGPYQRHICEIEMKPVTKKIALLWLVSKKKAKKKSRRYWVRPVLRKRNELGEYNHLIQELHSNDREYFFSIFPLASGTF